MELFLIRHAQSYNNALGDERRRIVDPPLTEIGLRQAELLAAFLANGSDYESAPCEGEPTNGGNGCGHGITRLYTSAMQRALQTAQAIGRALGLRPEVWVEVHEHGGMWLDHGEPVGVVGYPGMSRSEIAARFPEAILPPEITEEGWYDPTQGYETWEQAAGRAERVAAQLRARVPSDEHIAIISHGGFSHLLLRVLLHVMPEGDVFFHHDNTGITRLRFYENEQVSLRYLNRVSHLPGELVT